MQSPCTRRVSIRRVASLALAGTIAAATAAFAAPAQAQESFPSRPIRIVVPFPAGGTVDAAMRLVSQRLSEVIGQSVLIDNKPGANGMVGADAVAKAPADGYTLLAVSSTHVINPSLTASMSFDPVRDFSPVTILGTLPLVIAGNVEQPFRTFGEMVAYAKARPGQLAFGYTDASTQLFGEMVKSAAGIDLRMVPYKGGAPMLVDVLGGHIAMGATGAGSAHPHYKSAKIRVLAASEERRTPSMPEVPTIAESGYPGFNVQVWIAVMGPAGMPPAVVNRLNAGIVKVLAEPAVNARLAELGTVTRGSSPTEALMTLRADADMWSTAARKAGLKPQ